MGTRKLTARALNRATLARQLLLKREPLDVVEAVRRIVALQAQQPASPYIALWNRLAPFDPTALDAAMTDHRLVRATLMRITVHTVHADDYGPFREAMEPTLRGSRLGDPRYRASGLTPADADTFLPPLLTYADGHPRTAAELRTWLEEHLGTTAPDATTAPDTAAHRMLRHYAPLWHAPTGGPWSFDTRQSYVAASPRPALTDPDAATDGLRTLIRRYLQGFGPASVADMAQFALVQQRRIRTALQPLSEELEVLQAPDGKTPLYDLPGAPRPPEDTPAPPRLMAMWDSTLLAYADRGRVLPAEYRKYVTRMNGDVLPTLLVDGYVAGVWRPVGGAIEATAFHPLPDPVWGALAEEAAALQVFLTARADPTPYRRYDHWWAKPLPDTAETRLLPAG
ncbi:winged helix DNA-binding domain-containing protein [Streptomyces europaeiscabiei]|uniref:winged helix DNA-binding domain-containing protein n=1 Tax=Streptomyces europaeiscabiei TaxID=146819 RepID=UPI0029B24B7F|nr:winged helix DNA-binding domain-containing protein [Streptomyces europaeiscabiei]MDX3629680.1 winged helix DNA-binding domain-containing protein [Streptomyces europaeiscabiei]MDX3648297.1 winged helix DNA-binding domain-containing protein [Streptomyces europaeiscabiei]WUD32990.1 winged helix DNA-binding domain-containing protein [Streptomyces europaeiscabiei]